MLVDIREVEFFRRMGPLIQCELHKHGFWAACRLARIREMQERRARVRFWQGIWLW